MSFKSAAPFPYSESWWRVTLSSIGDAVIVTDASGRVAFLNPVAESLTGWKNDEALNKALEEIFPIFKEGTRERLELPIHKVIQTGNTADLANHTVLLSRSGSEVQIDDSAAPIKGEDGNIFGVVLVFRDVTVKKQAQTERAYLAAIVDSSEDAIVGKTLDSVIKTWNHAAERMFGYSAEEAIGQRIHLLIPLERYGEEEEILSLLRQGRRIEHYETVRRKKDGTLIEVSLTVSPIKDEDGNIVGASKIARDVTEKKRTERELKESHETLKHVYEEMSKARMDAENANRLKDDFLATVSHELRTPLNAILGWARLLRMGNLDDDNRKRAIETIERNAVSQGQIIEDILDVSRIITGKIRLEISNVEIGQLVSEAVESLRPTAEAKEILLQTILDTNPNPVRGDTQRLQQVLWNLLTNAIKFTSKGGRVQVTLQRVGSQVEISVTDNGQGIRPEFLPYVFERFRQADSSTKRSHGGLGLGLAIVRQLTELHGGTVSVDSAGEGLGATFSVRLPLAPLRDSRQQDQGWSVPVPRAVEGPMPMGQALKGVRVLVVDDEADACELLRVVLEKCGAEVRVSYSAATAFESFQQWKPDVLLSDIGMPLADGYDLIRQVRALSHKDGGSIPAAALTAYATADDRLRVLQAGFQTHIAKPVEPMELMAVVAVLAGKTGTAKDK
jgi:PAS domain S-box-containing protein